MLGRHCRSSSPVGRNHLRTLEVAENSRWAGDGFRRPGVLADFWRRLRRTCWRSLDEGSRAGSSSSRAVQAQVLVSSGLHSSAITAGGQERERGRSRDEPRRLWKQREASWKASWPVFGGARECTGKPWWLSGIGRQAWQGLAGVMADVRDLWEVVEECRNQRGGADQFGHVRASLSELRQ